LAFFGRFVEKRPRLGDLPVWLDDLAARLDEKTAWLDEIPVRINGLTVRLAEDSVWFFRSAVRLTGKTAPENEVGKRLRLGRWGAGALGRWGAGALGRWGAGALGDSPHFCGLKYRGAANSSRTFSEGGCTEDNEDNEGGFPRLGTFFQGSE